MKIAVVGSGISGLTAAYLLSQHHQVSVFEADDRIGGHTHTVRASDGKRDWPVDTGFIVFNHKTYPNFIRLMQELGVAWQNSEMSFSVSDDNFAFSPSTLVGLFGCPQNLCRPALWRLPLEIVKFRRLSEKLLEQSEYTNETLGEFLSRHRFSRFFRDFFLVPMGAAIWSAGPGSFADIPILFFARFFANHAFLKLDQPRWLTLKGGSSSYLKPLTERFAARIFINSPVLAISRENDKVSLKIGTNQEFFDQVVVACHSDQALQIIKDPCTAEREMLAAVPYQPNEVILHTDSNLLPSRESAWASWNYRVPKTPGRPVILTYAMNRLQKLKATKQFCVTLNAGAAIDDSKRLRSFVYAHPIFTTAGIKAQQRWQEINGNNRTWYAGAWWRYGFHEDGMRSGLRVARALGVRWP